MNEAFILTAHNLFIAPLRSLHQQCKLSELLHVCEHISDLLINKSDNILNKNFGYSIQKETLKANNKYDRFKQSVLDSLKLQTEVGCLTRKNVGMFGSFATLHPVTIRSYIQNIEKNTELETYKISLKEFHDHLIVNNRQHLDSFEDCRLIHRLSDDEFINTYNLTNEFAENLEDYH